MLGRMDPERDLVAGTRFKLRRAQEHLNALDAGVAGFLGREPYAVIGRFEGGRTRHVHEFIEMEKPPVEWGVWIGEFAYNLRAALDQAVYHLTLSFSHKELPGIGFPVEGTREAFFALSKKTGNLSSHSGLWRIRGTAPDVQHLVESWQPYNDPKGDGALIAVLSRVGNQDKHRVPVLAAATFVEGGIILTPPHPGRSRLHSGPTQHGDIVTEYEFVSPAPPATTVRGEFRFDVVLEGFGEVPAVRLLTDVYERVKHMLNSLLMRAQI